MATAVAVVTLKYDVRHSHLLRAPPVVGVYITICQEYWLGCRFLVRYGSADVYCSYGYTFSARLALGLVTVNCCEILTNPLYSVTSGMTRRVP